MKIVIFGCGRSGKGLFLTLFKQNHDVSIIDDDESNLLPLQSYQQVFFNSYLVESLWDTLRIHECDAIIACTKSDEMNAIIARAAKTMYHVPKTIAFIQHPDKVHLYEHLGVQTISTTDWGIKRAIHMLSYNHLQTLYTLGDNELQILRIPVLNDWVHQTIDAFEHNEPFTIIAIERKNHTFIPLQGTILEEQDILYIIIEDCNRQRIETFIKES